MAKSAKRRHHIERLKKNRKNYWGRSYPRSIMEPLTPKQLNQVVRYPKLCGCFMCSRNKKKVFGSTFYAHKQDVLSRFEIKEATKMQLKEVRKAVDDFFSDTTRSKRETKNGLEELQDQIASYIEALDSDDGDCDEDSDND